ncbi:MAG TPA: phospholipase D family protein [Caldimonas sp.]|nr:phospholipase D family protein [Caldimonas sp.]
MSQNVCCRIDRVGRTLLRTVLAGLAVALAACASLPDRATLALEPTHAARDGAGTPLGRIAASALRDDGDSAFRLLPLAQPAYETRVELARRAVRTLDVQTFVLNGDGVGLHVLAALRDAALRGVRVRVLVDDLHSADVEPALSDVVAYPNVEVRLINPFVRLRGSDGAKLFSSLDELHRVNHRMHNKLFAADNAMAVFGGRNLGDEYFMRVERGGNFIDLDVLAAGQAVHELEDAFDAYWNSEHAWPIDAIVPPRDDAETRRRRFDARVATVATPPPDTGIPERLRNYGTAPADIAEGRPGLRGALATVAVDPIDKLAGTRVGDRTGTVRATIAEAMRAAEHEVFVVSPYFVPGALGIESMRGLRDRGVRLRLLTNSLAATDEPAVHAGYVAYRDDMARIGVEIYELSPRLAREEARLGRFGQSVGALHAKIVIIDRRRIFVGSTNLDGRSERYNTEDGVLIESAVLANELLELMDFESSCYRVSLDESGHLQWTEHRRGRAPVVHHDEPEASWARRLNARLLGGLLPQEWL